MFITSIGIIIGMTALALFGVGIVFFLVEVSSKKEEKDMED